MSKTNSAEPLTNKYEALEKKLEEQHQKNEVLNNKLTRLRVDHQRIVTVASERLETLQKIYGSVAWTISRPLWFFEQQLCKVTGFLKSIPHAIKLNGGLIQTLENLVLTLKNSGVRGLKNKVNHLDKYVVSLSAYQQWIDSFDTITEESRLNFFNEIKNFNQRPLISVVMPVYNPPVELLESAINSVQQQLYTHWELCIADDSSTDPAIRKLLEKYESEDKRIKVVYRESNGHISESTNSALEITDGEFVALLDHDDELSEHALFWVVDTINRFPDTQMIYSDEDKIDIRGKRSAPYFKCDWNLDLFLSQNMFSHLGVYRRDLIEKVGGFRKGFEGSQDYDLALRCIEKIPSQQIQHIPRVLYHWRVMPGSTALASAEKPYAVIAGEKAISEYLERNNVAAEVELLKFGYRVKYQIPAPEPLVTLIIPTRDGVDVLQSCIESVFAKTSYPNYEVIIVDNGSNEPETLAYLERINNDHRVRILRDDGPFNFSALNNLGVKHANGRIIGLLNNDVEVITSEWMGELVSHASRSEVGAVGAKLLYPDGSLQHGGVIVGLGDSAAHAHRHLPKSGIGYFGRAALIQSFSAVTGACLFVRKELYEEVGGLNESELAIAFNDVDFCLKLMKLGYRNVWTPFAELYHHESKTRGTDEILTEKRMRLLKENDYLKTHWENVLEHDPAYSPNLTIHEEDFSMALQPRIQHVL